MYSKLNNFSNGFRPTYIPNASTNNPKLVVTNDTFNRHPYMNLINNLRTKLFFKLAYWATRIGMALTFMTSGLRKMPGIKFTELPLDNPVGAYFHAMHETGFYWNFIGYFQILIGLMAFFNRTIVMSSVLMMPVTINIFLISVSLNMRGTPFITAAMVLGNIFLMLWHHENLSPILKRPITDL